MKREKTRHATQAREVEIPPDTYRPSAAELRETLTKGPAAACRVHVTKSGGSGLPWEQLLAEAPEPEPDEEDGGDDGSGGGGGFGGVEGEARESVPGSPGNLTAVGGDGQVVLSWDAPESDGGAVRDSSI